MKLYTSATNSRGKDVGVGGGAKSQSVHTRTWTHGIKVVSYAVGDEISFEVYSTGGSDNPLTKEKIGVLTLVNGEPKFTKAKK